MRAGDLLYKRPWTGQGGNQDLPPQPCRVVAVDPAGWWYTVEFTYEGRAGRRSFRESYPPGGADRGSGL